MKYYKYEMDMTLLNILCVVLFFPLGIIIYLLDLESSIDLFFFVFYFLWMFLHELLHGLGFILNKDIDKKNVFYGVSLEKGIMYCMCKQKISKKGIMISILFPFIVIGIFTFFLGIIINNKLLQCLSLFNIVGCIGDLVMFFDFFKLSDFQYTDLDDCTGFVLISKHDLSNKKLFGLKLIDSGNIDALEKPKEYQKIKFSKFSIIVFIILIVCVIVNVLC